MIGIENEKHFARAAFVRTTGVSVIPSTLQRLHGFGYNGIVRIHLSTWLVLKLEGSVHSVPRDVTLPSLDNYYGRTVAVHDLLKGREYNQNKAVEGFDESTSTSLGPCGDLRRHGAQHRHRPRWLPAPQLYRRLPDGASAQDAPQWRQRSFGRPSRCRTAR